MTLVRYKENKGQHTLHAYGHATGNEKVCAGISALLSALAAYLEMNDGAKMRANLVESGEVLLDYTGGKDVKAAYEMALVGLTLMQNTFPEQVRVEIADG